MYTQHRLPVKLSDEKRTEIEKRNADIDLTLIGEQELLDEARSEHKARTSAVKDEKKRSLKTLRDGYELLDVKAMEYVNEEEGTIEYVDEEGVKIHERALTLEERRQYRIQFGRRQTTD